MLTFLIDLAVILILLFFIWSGYRKGLILSAATLVIFFVSVMIGGSIATQYTESAAGFFDDLLGWVADEATENAIAQHGVPRNNTITDAQISRVANTALAELGVYPKATEYLSGVVVETYRRNAGTLYETVSQVLVRAVTWVALFVAGFLISNLLLSLIANFISAMFKLPVLRFLDTVGGVAMGFVLGLLMLFVIGMAIRYAGIVIPDELLEDTRFLSMFIDSTPFGNLIAIG
ncbi:MAG: CvpA family protein [Oscillospiraceae bacterium]|nr:CvpA family protein [Oscillospiraceae bacterium]